MNLLPSLKMDRMVSLSFAVIIHLLLLFGVNIAFLKAAEYGVQAGSGGIEISLVAALPETHIAQKLNLRQEETVTSTPYAAKADDMLLPEKIKKNPADKPVIKTEIKPDRKDVINPAKERGDGSSKIPGNAATSFYSHGGADTTAKPNYLKNPAPEYPEVSKELGEQGVVFLKVFVEKDGKPAQVIIQKSSGHARLDSSAIKAVKKWQFSPGRIGNMCFSSWVKIPIRFVLEDNKIISKS